MAVYPLLKEGRSAALTPMISPGITPNIPSKKPPLRNGPQNPPLVRLRSRRRTRSQPCRRRHCRLSLQGPRPAQLPPSQLHGQPVPSEIGQSRVPAEGDARPPPGVTKQYITVYSLTAPGR
jgi:hypothetical protein